MRIFKNIVWLILLFLLPVKAGAVQDVHVVQFVLDGVHHEVLKEEIEAGRLPNLQKHFWEEGAVFDRALTTYPTVSSPGYVSFATGLSAGNSGIFFLEWFDRTQERVVGYLSPAGHARVNEDLLNRIALRDLDETQLYNPFTLFEKIAPEPTAAIYTPFHRGASTVHPKKYPIRALFSGLIAKDGLQLNRLAMRQLEKLFDNPVKKIPRYTLMGLYGTDFYGHAEGPESEEVRLVLKQFDNLFGQFAAQLKEKNLAGKTYLIVTADHGMHAAGKKLDLWEYLWKEGLRRKDKVYLTNRGVSSAFLYLAGPDGWKDIPDLHRLRHYPAQKGVIDLIAALIRKEGVDWIGVRDDFDRVRLYSAEGEAVITQLIVGDEAFYSYLYRGGDPLGLAADPNLKEMLDGRPWPSDAWTQKNVAPVELSHLFADPRAGDILVSAEGAWGFRKAKAGTHGSLTDDDMQIPLWIAGPGIPKGHFQEARSVDLYPTILNWLGLWQTDPKTNQEGKLLFVKAEPETIDAKTEALANMEAYLMELPPLFKLPNRDEVSQKVRALIPGGLQGTLLEECEAEIETRYQRWKKLDTMEKKMQNPRNPLDVPAPLRENMEWLLANEKNIEFMRLRRMEDIRSILEER